MADKPYTVRIHYQTLCYTDYNVYATSEQEAKEKARARFDKHVSTWVDDGGYPKILTDMEIRHGG